ncbi:MAG: hypothetical protein JO170_30740 [Verrucomicrobia bacterium]|nr:hypothetical protein [Verrucomicrobiota bacterium]
MKILNVAVQWQRELEPKLAKEEPLKRASYQSSTNRSRKLLRDHGVLKISLAHHPLGVKHRQFVVALHSLS